MSIYITDECINCGACEPECPNNAIYDGGIEWAYADGTGVSGKFNLVDGLEVDAEEMNAPIEEDFYFIVPDKCTECQGFHEEPQCAAVCPVDCCIPMAEQLKSMEDELAQETIQNNPSDTEIQFLQTKIQKFKEDKNLIESEERLLKKKEILHL
ncbi:MAG: 4Fe-4S dicluster domain-containing protein [Saprospiraceae bacterium]|nr:4Fe-4S dicluster domain-containing protein [Saprospiraceae bacterium]